MKRCLSIAGLLLIFALVCALPVAADNLYASIRGTVADPTGAMMAGVKLTATNTATNLSYSTVSNKDGVFVFQQVIVGDYKVRAEQSGFKVYQASGIHVDLNQVYELPVKLAVGAVSEELMVEANPVQVETTSMQQGAVVTGDQIVDMPLNGRNWTQLQQLEPGVVASSDRFGSYSTNGSGTQQNNFLINGTDTNDAALNDALLVPSPDAIGEFNMVTSTINPEFGRNSGAIINATIKNGTNQFHGDAFDFYRDTFMDAKGWFEPAAGTWHRNQFGGTFGGPVIKDKTFFFFSYQGQRTQEPQAEEAPAVFTAAQRGGNFAGAGAFPNGNPIPRNLYGDSASPCPVSGGVQCTAGAINPATSLPYSYADLFSTGQIPTQDFDQLQTQLMNTYVPLPNLGSNLYQFNSVEQLLDDQYIYRIDHKLRQNDALWFYGMWERTPTTEGIPFVGATLPGFAETDARHYQQYTFSWSHTFSPTMLNEARISYLRFNFKAVEPVDPINPTTFGFSGIIPQTYAGASLPVENVGGGYFSLGFSSDGPQPRIQNDYQFTDNLSKVWGHHTFKAGFNLLRLEINNPFYSSLSGTFTFNGSGVYTSGSQLADFLLGTPDSYSQGSGSIIYGRGAEYYAYVQDQWQIRPSLTLTFGTGWDLDTPWRNLYDNGLQNGAWRPGQQSTVYPDMPPGFVYPGDAGINKYGGVSVHYDNFAPRLGFAWSPGGKSNWSIRGGIGLYFNRSEEEPTLQSLLNPPFALGTTAGTIYGSPVLETPFVGYTACTTAGGAPNVCGTTTRPQAFPYTPPPKGATFDPSVYYPIGFDFTVFDPNYTSPRSANFNLTVQRQLDRATIVSVGYVGSIGRHEEGANDVNQAGVFPGTNAAAAAAGCPSGLEMAFCPSGVANGSTPYNINVYGQPGVAYSAWNSNYNSLQVSLNRRFSKGLQVLASYTWSRYFDESSSFENGSFNGPGVSPWISGQNYAPSASDAPQRLVVSWTYTLPIYKFTHVAKRLTDDWNLSGIYTLQHGFPVPVFDLWEHSVTCDLEGIAFYFCPDKPNQIGKVSVINDPRHFQVGCDVACSPGANAGQGNSGYYWFTNGAAAFTNDCPGNVVSGACFGVNPGYTGTGIGNAVRNPLYGPGLNFADIAIEKNVHINESKYFQFRLETFNTFNHANFCPPANFGSCGGTPSNDASFLNGGTFGQLFGVRSISTNGDGRVLQLGGKFYF